KELGDDATIVGVSLGAERDFKFKPKKGFYPKNMLKYNDNNNDITLTLHHGSILVMKDPTNNHWMHSLPKRAGIKKPRISLTFRYLHLDKLQ
ncbi:MAG: alpha-ketoglutarate-dependent dioxygenase AlkB, partial [Nitrososphaeraceae archaeon]|nr:alpha-ketoglutarate-dependent dioxygenase AlkB [Nitrososphaeraceae archaeon]